MEAPHRADENMYSIIFTVYLLPSKCCQDVKTGSRRWFSGTSSKNEAVILGASDAIMKNSRTATKNVLTQTLHELPATGKGKGYACVSQHKTATPWSLLANEALHLILETQFKYHTIQSFRGILTIYTKLNNHNHHLMNMLHLQMKPCTHSQAIPTPTFLLLGPKAWQEAKKGFVLAKSESAKQYGMGDMVAGGRACWSHCTS